eukprot:TRINITY_DN15684_c0_g1_i1.p1 TRINITY_DN15684_c0_g1~~TRINITY_DN15684_c0_g1_i1.p1  ORF type:complete len:304 (+),score=42.28 TRINITY_DN15684_c0_g1_i1:63-974(+)
MSGVAWIAADWGTTRLRLWAISASGEILHHVSKDCGMATLERDQFEPTLISIVEEWLPQSTQSLPVIACGMVGAKQGWHEVPYKAVPCSIEGQMSHVPTIDARIQMYICWGLKQLDPADVMRGEETQIAGWLATDPDYSGVVCLPGTHSKWAEVGKGQVSGFQSFMTGELFSLLAQKSVLRFSIDTEEWSDQEFQQALAVAIEDPASISGRLFALRAQALVGDAGCTGASSRLSGYLIGLELAASRRYWEGRHVAIIAASSLANLYKQALEKLEQKVSLLSAEEMTLAGLRAAYGTAAASQDA